MVKKLLLVFTLAASVLSACQPQSAEPTVQVLVETQVAAALTNTAAASSPTPQATLIPPSPLPPTFTSAPDSPTLDLPPTETPVPPTATATPETPIPTNAPNCTNQASFVEDVTIPDNSSVGAGQAFIKTWRIRNTGTCVWGPGYTLVHYSEETLGAPISTTLGVAFPNQTLDVSVSLTAPATTGLHRGNFVIQNPAGLIMKLDDDSGLWVIINVTATGAVSTPTLAPGTSSAGSGAGGGAGSGSGYAAVSCAYSLDAGKVSEVVVAINAYRAQSGVAAYAVNTRLTEAAQAHANDMACNQLFFHNGSNGSTPQTRVATSGYAASAVTENVYGSYPPLNGQGAVNWWMTDQTDTTHNTNLISTRYTEIGVGYSFFNNFGYYVVVFAKP
jgi:uncharacterized protein YkwD